MKVDRIQQEYQRLQSIVHLQEAKHHDKLVEDNRQHIQKQQVSETDRIMRNRRLGLDGQNVDTFA